MNSVSAMLQRMRELSVQAGNGTYTTNDREMLQLEVNELKDEINRVSRTAEFNTKRLLDGSGTALWSSSEDYLGAIVRGPEAAEGNYQVDTSIIPGKNYIYKSNIQEVKKGVLVGEAKTFTPTDTDGNPIQGDDSKGRLVSVKNPQNFPITDENGINIIVGDVNQNAWNADSVISETKKDMQIFHQEGSNFKVKHIEMPTDKGDNIGVTDNRGTFEGFFEIEILSSVDNVDRNSQFKFKYRFLDSKTGTLTPYQEGSLKASNEQLGNGSLLKDTMKMMITTPVGDDGNTKTIGIAIPFGSTIKAGDKIMSSIGKSYVDGTYPQNGVSSSGGGTIKIGNGPRLHLTEPGALVKRDNNNGKVDYNDVEYHMGRLDPETGRAEYGSITLQFQEGAGEAGGNPTVGGLQIGRTNIIVRDSGPATKDTKLKDLVGFTNADGVDLLANTQEIKIYNNGKYESIFLESDDTLEDFDNKMTAALMKLGLGGDPRTKEGKKINEQLVRYVSKEGIPGSDHNKALETSNESVPGTFLIQSAAIGKDSELVFTADENIMKALGLATIQKGENSSTDIYVTDAHTGKFIGKDNINDGMGKNIIKGIDITVEQNSGVTPKWNDAEKRFDFTPTKDKETAYLHIVDNRTELQIGANEGQTLNISVGQLDTTGLDINDVYVIDMELSQRSITKIDKALQQISSIRATIGAQVNRLEYTIDNLDTARQNLTSAESRIRDLDMAEETTNMTKNQILVQSATSMLAQANKVPRQALQLLQGLG